MELNVTSNNIVSTVKFPNSSSPEKEILLRTFVQQNSISESNDKSENSSFKSRQLIADGPTVGLITALTFFIVVVVVLNTFTLYGIWKLPKRHKIDLYMANLAVVDILLGVLVFPLMSVVVVLGYFPFGSVLCSFWVFADYYLIIVYSFSITALVCMCLWMIRWPDSYRETTWNTHWTIIGYLWFGVNAVWTAPFVHDRLNFIYPSGICGFSLEKNNYFAFYIGMSGFYVPLLISVGSAIYSAVLIRRYHRSKIFNRIEILPTTTSRRNSVISNNDRGKKLQKIPSMYIDDVRQGTEYYPLVTSVLILFFICRSLFYVYFGAEPFVEQIFPPDLSNGVYWLLHANAALSPLLHFSLDSHLRNTLLQSLWGRRSIEMLN